MVSRGKAIKTVIAGGVGVAVVGLSVTAAWPSDPGLRAVPDHQQLVSRPMSTAWSASWSDTTQPTPSITQSSAPSTLESSPRQRLQPRPRVRQCPGSACRPRSPCRPGF